MIANDRRPTHASHATLSRVSIFRYSEPTVPVFPHNAIPKTSTSPLLGKGPDG